MILTPQFNVWARATLKPTSKHNAARTQRHNDKQRKKRK